MDNFKFHAYLIECLTNLHVGSGDNNYGIVDKEVQRDSISNVPVIHASSLKGAFREYFEKVAGWENSPEGKKKLVTLFGSDKNEQGKESVFKQGGLRFFEARLLSIPVRGTGPSSKAFYRATSSEIAKDFNTAIQTFGINSSVLDESNESEKAETEFGNFSLLSKPGHVGINAVKVSHETLNGEVLKHLPVIARNSLDNGQSENLWYEEIVPRESRFYFFAGATAEMKDIDFKKDFDDNIVGEKRIVQIGANATVGYGYCKITKIGQS